MVPFTPYLLTTVLPNLAHHVAAIQTAARQTNNQLIRVIQSLPPPSEHTTRQNADRASTNGPSPLPPASPLPTASTLASSRPSTATKDSSSETFSNTATPTAATPLPPGHRSRHSISQMEVGRLISTAQPTVQTQTETASTQPSRSESPISTVSAPQVQQSPEASVVQEKEKDLFDYPKTVHSVTLQLLSEHEETRVAALKWLLMLHQKAPKIVSFVK